MELFMCLAFLLLSIVFGVDSQMTVGRSGVGSCPMPTDVNATSTTLISLSININDASASDRPTVTIMNFSLVCVSPGLTRGTVSSFSVVVEYVCNGGVSECDGTTRQVNQFQWDCNSDNTFNAAQIAGGGLITQDPVANLTTPLVDECGRCADIGGPADIVNHCAPCQAEQMCNEGQMRCVNVRGALAGGDLQENCCNWYLGGSCMVSCPANLTGDDEPGTLYDCGCGKLSLEFGELEYSSRFIVDSVATHNCDRDNGYVPSGNSNQRTCQQTGGWSGSEITCELKVCDPDVIERPLNGRVTISTFTFGSIAAFECDNGFTLVGDMSRVCEIDGWSGNNPTCVTTATTTTVATGTTAQQGSACDTACIIGIVLAILAVIILAALLAGVGYALYSYMNNPDTKLAKLDPNGINGVARDNPLYLDPGAVVGADAVEGAEAA